MNTKTAVTAVLPGGAPPPACAGNAGRQGLATGGVGSSGGTVGSGGVGGGSVSGSAAVSTIGNRPGRDLDRRRVRPAPPRGRGGS